MKMVVFGGDLEALLTALCLKHSGVEEVLLRTMAPPESDLPILSCSPSGTKVLTALGLGPGVMELASQATAEHVRSGPLNYPLAMRPLGQFNADRYGAPQLLLPSDGLTALLQQACASTGIGFTEDDDATIQVFAGHSDCPYPAVRDQHTTPWEHRIYRRAVSSSFAIEEFRLSQLSVSSTRYCRGAAWTSVIAQQGEAVSWLEEELVDAEEVYRETIIDSSPLEYWHSDNQVLVGSVAHPVMPFVDLSLTLALEDAWVLSRMFDQYEEDTSTALAEYQRFRYRRCTRVQAHARAIAQRDCQATKRSAFARNLRLALSSRFLPELYMQRFDWIHQYDCIRGFN